MTFYKLSVREITHRLRSLPVSQLLSTSGAQLSVKRVLSSKSSKIFDESDPKTIEIKKELSDVKDKQYYNEYDQEGFGWVYAKKPHKYLCKEGKAYIWCSCGRSHTQPFCDGTHRNKHLQITLKPVRWDCTETKEVWFCNCKQTRHRPFCDGSHNQPAVQSGHSTIRDARSPQFVDTTVKIKS